MNDSIPKELGNKWVNYSLCPNVMLERVSRTGYRREGIYAKPHIFTNLNKESWQFSEISVDGEHETKYLAPRVKLITDILQKLQGVQRSRKIKTHLMKSSIHFWLKHHQHSNWKKISLLIKNVYENPMANILSLMITNWIL